MGKKAGAGKTIIGPSNPQQFLFEMVQPTVAEFMAARLDMRRGVLAAFMVTHLVDHIFYAPEPEQAALRIGTDNLNVFKDELEKRCVELGYVRELTNRIKHLSVNRILHVGEDYPALLLDEGGKGRLLMEDRTPFSIGPPALVLTLEDNRHDLARVVAVAAVFLEKHTAKPFT